MDINVINYKTLEASGRVDAKYYTSPGFFAAKKIDAAKMKGILFSDLNGGKNLVNIPKLNRFKCAYAGKSEIGAPYLRPYDVFEYLPTSFLQLSKNRTRAINDYYLKPGQILQTCSGRNLGPLTMADNYLKEFVIGSDMLRIEIKDEKWRFYVLAYLKSTIGQSLLKWGKTGSVIDHLSPDHLICTEIPILDEKIRIQIFELMKQGYVLREEARIGLRDQLASYESKLPSLEREVELKDGWTIHNNEIVDRLDAAFYDPLVKKTINHLKQMNGQYVKNYALVIKPKGRYKTYYVDSQHGLPILSGTQLLQDQPINLSFIASRAFKEVSDYSLKEGWIAYQADGRVEKGLGTPAYIGKDREGWLASGHVGRICPKNEKDSGWLYLATRIEHSQIQIKSKASGSVVDSTFPNDVEDVILPPKLNVNGEKIKECWNKFGEAKAKEDSAISIFNDFFDTI